MDLHLLTNLSGPTICPVDPGDIVQRQGCKLAALSEISLHRQLEYQRTLQKTCNSQTDFEHAHCASGARR